MKIFEIREDQFRKKAGYIDAAHKWGLPGVECPACRQIWSRVGLEYPAVDLTDLADEKLHREPRLEPLNVYLELRDKIARAFPHLPRLKPGTDFGPSEGKAVGHLKGFVWRAWWTICLEAGALEKLKGRGLSLPPAVRPELKFRREPQDVFELDLPLRAVLANPVYDGVQLRYCKACGRDSGSKPQEVLIDGATIPTTSTSFG